MFQDLDSRLRGNGRKIKSENLYSAVNQQERLRKEINPWYISGFNDGEGTFHVAFTKRPDLSRAWAIIPEFHINQDRGRAAVLYEIKRFFGCGQIRENHHGKSNDQTLVYVVRKRADLLDTIIPFFERYPLRSQKQHDFEVFAKIVRAIDKNVHATHDGFCALVTQAFTMNYGGRYRKRAIETILSSESSETTC